ncbi:fimbria/pilus chaperone family protein [Pseudomonas sp. LS1212]|uniref:fimbria/pilus chaperone family protein n=1 Tax=Pseudomonas sp. LS1212 TaxID=2972478 RepID=UPI00215CCA5D|nr:fimbria/pilus chaperone family protein [Pseudomonas sp. LS1212]UVJ45135.1 fimbria/pilus chaperone family protein [Pseudomonas sp. LS1212]
MKLTQVRRRAQRLSVFAGLLTLCAALSSWADGMIPETSVVIVKEADGEASIKVRNSDTSTALLHVTLQNVPEDPEPLLFLTQPVWRVEAGKEQLVRFILRSEKPLQTQRLKRVIFEGIPQTAKAAEAGQARVGVSVRQNLPVILHPKGLAANREPWTGLQWSLADGKLTVRNETSYVVRLAQELKLLPSNQAARLPRSYVLPGDHITVEVDGPVNGAPATVKLFPATVYGFAVDAYEAPLRATGA